MDFLETLLFFILQGGIKTMISDNLKSLRKRCRLTQEQVAEKLNVSRQAVSKWESGETIPDIYNCFEIAKLYDVTLDDLVNQKYSSKLSPKGKHLFGIVKLDDENRIIIPKKARKIFNIHKGDKLILLGDEEQGLALVKTDELFKFANEILHAKTIDASNDEETEVNDNESC